MTISKVYCVGDSTLDNFYWLIDREGSNLEKANLQKAYLRRANLRKARGVPAELLSEVETLYAVKIGSQLKKQIKKDYPHLLEKP